MKILAIDTASDACSAALVHDADIMSRFEIAPRQHAELIFEMIDEVLTETGLTLNTLDAIAFGRGPGAFTGLRIAAAVTQGLAFAAELPVIPVSDLAMLAQGMVRTHGADRILACVDARMGEVYWGEFEIGTDGLVNAGEPERLDRPENCRPPPGNGGWWGVGSGWQRYDKLRERIGPCLVGMETGREPDARDACALATRALSVGEVVAAADAVPVYLREQVVWKQKL